MLTSENVVHHGGKWISLNGKWYINYALKFTVTYDDFVEWVETMKYIKPDPRSYEYKKNCTAEKEIGWPKFVFAFYDFIEEHNGSFPTEMEYVEYYLAKHKDKVSEIINKNKKEAETFDQVWTDFTFRLMRIYPSLLRDVSGILLLDSLGYPVFYNPKIDIYKGCDGVVMYEDKYYGINMYLNSERGREQRNRKFNKFPKEFERVEWPIEPKNSAMENDDIFLYTMEEFKQIEDALRK